MLSLSKFFYEEVKLSSRRSMIVVLFLSKIFAEEYNCMQIIFFPDLLLLLVDRKWNQKFLEPFKTGGEIKNYLFLSFKCNIFSQEYDLMSNLWIYIFSYLFFSTHLENVNLSWFIYFSHYFRRWGFSKVISFFCAMIKIENFDRSSLVISKLLLDKMSIFFDKINIIVIWEVVFVWNAFFFF